MRRLPPGSGALGLAGAGLLFTFLWLMVGDLGIAVRERAALPSGLELLRRNGASDTITALLVSTIPALLSLLVVPCVGYHSDRYRSRWGRRRPFLLIATPIGAAALIGLALSPALSAATDLALGSLSPGLRICKLAYFCLFWTCFECAALIVSAMFTGLISDVVPHRLLGRFYAVVRVVGLSVGIAFNAMVFALTDQYLYELLAVFALLFSAPVLLMCVMLKEAPSDQAALTMPPPARSWLVPRAHILDCFSQRLAPWIFGAFVLAGITFTPFNTFCQYYAQMTGLSKAELGQMNAYGYGISIVSAFGVGWLVDRYGPVRISGILMAAYLCAAAAGYLWLRDSFSFRLFYGAHVVISGAYFTAAASMPMALFPNAKFVQYNSTKDLLVALASIAVNSVQGPILDHSGHDYSLTLLGASASSLLCVVCLLRVQAQHEKNRSTPQGILRPNPER